MNMNDKHAMLYPPIEGDGNMDMNERNSAAIAIGLPVEAPPTYEMAMSTRPNSQISGMITGGMIAALPAPIPIDDREIYCGRPYTPIDPSNRQSPRLPRTPLSIRSVIRDQPTLQIHEECDFECEQPEPVIHGLPQIHTPLPPTLGPKPCTVQCPACGTFKATRVEFVPNSRTHLCALVLCLVGWCCCACCIPYCMNSCRTGNHYCSKCNTFLGCYNPRGICDN